MKAMACSAWSVLLLVTLAVCVCDVHGQLPAAPTAIGFMGDRSRDITLPKGWYQLSDNYWFLSGKKQFFTSGSFSNSRFTAPKSGLYYVSLMMRLDRCSSSETQIVVNGVRNSNAGLSSFESKFYNYNSRGSTAVIYMNIGDYLTVGFNNNVACTLQHESSFSVFYMGSLWSRIGVQVDLDNARTYGKGWNTIQSYVYNLKAGNLWMNTPGNANFDIRTGRFTAPCSGVYFVAANFHFTGTGTGSYYRLLISVNGAADPNNGLHAIRDGDSSSSWSLHVSGTVYLAKGWYLLAYVLASNDLSWQLSSYSGLTVLYLSQYGLFAPGALYSLKSNLLVPRNVYTAVPNWGNTRNGNYIQNTRGTFSGGVFTIPQNGYYIISAQMRFDGCRNSWYQRLMVSINGSPDVNGGLHSIRGQVTANYYTIHLSGVLSLRTNDQLRVYVYVGGSSCYAQTESGFSAGYIGSYTPSTGLHADKSADTTYSKAGWQEINGYSTTYATNNGLYATDTSTAAAYGRYTVQVPGVYYVGANVRMTLAANNYSRIVVAKNGQYSDSNGLSAMESRASAQRDGTLSVCGFMKLDQGDYVSVFAFTGDTSWKVLSDSSVSVARVGSASYVSAFMADLPNTFTIPKAGTYTALGGFQTTSSTDNGVFQTDYLFNKVTGAFTAPYDGIYFFTANVRFDKVMPSTTYRINIASGVAVFNGIVTSRDTVATTQTTQSFTESVSGTLKLNAGDVVRLYVYASKALATVSTETSFSGSLIAGPSSAGFQVYFPGNVVVPRFLRPQVSTWSAKTRTYLQGFTYRSAYFTVPYLGTYLVTANMKLTGLNVGATYILQGYINGITNSKNGLYSVFKAPSTTYSVSMVGSILLGMAQTLSFGISSTSDPSFTVLAESGFGAVYVPTQPYQPSSFLADLATTTFSRTVNAWARMTNLFYSANLIQQQRGMHNFGQGTINKATGYYTARESGIYWVSANFVVQSLGGTYLQVAVAKNGKVDVENGVSAYYGNPLGGVQSVHLSGAMMVNSGETLSLWWKSGNDNNYYLRSESSFGAQFLGPRRLGFSADLVPTITRKATGFYQIANWRTSGSSTLFDTSAGAFNRTTGVFTVPSDGLYLVAANVRVDKSDVSYVEAKVVVNGVTGFNTPLSYAKSGAVGKLQSHLPISGYVSLNAGDKVELQVQSLQDTNWVIGTSSGFSMVYLFHPSAAQGFIAQPSIQYGYRASIWNNVYLNWVTNGPFGFSSSNFDVRAGRYYTTAPGMYLVTFNLRVTGLSGAYVRAAISVDGCTPSTSSACPNGLYSDLQYVQDATQPNVVMASGVMALSSFRYLYLRLLCSKTCTVEKESSWSIVFMGTADNIQCNNGGPIFTVNPDTTVAQVGQLATMTCLAHSAPDPSTYTWRKDGVNIPGATTSTLTFTAVKESDNANYYCIATSNRRTTYSWTSSFRVISHDGEDGAFSVGGTTLTRGRGTQDIYRWARPATGSSPYFYTSTLDFNTNNGFFYARVEGVYIISATVYISSMSSSYAMMYLYSTGTSSSYTYFPVAAAPFKTVSLRTLSCSGAMYLRVGQYVRVRIYNPDDSSWQVGSYSTFSGRFIGPAEVVPGVSTRVSSVTSYKTGWTEIKNFVKPTSTFNVQWMTGNSFDSSTGRYTANCDGLYYISASLRVTRDGSTAGYMRLSLAVSGATTYTDDISGPAPVNRAVFSLNGQRVINLKKGQYVSVYVFMDKGTAWRAESAVFSVAFLGTATPSVPGFFASKIASVRRSTGWYTIPVWKTSDPKSSALHSNAGTDFNPSTGIFKASTSGTYFVSASVRIDSSCSGTFRLLIDVNNKRSANGPQAFYNPGGQCLYNTLTASGIVQLTAGDTVRLNIYASSDTSWTLQAGALFSIQLIDRINPSMHADLGVSVAQKAVGWKEITSWDVKSTASNGLYDSGVQFNPSTGRFTAGSDGIYYVSAVIRLDGIGSGFARMVVAVNNQPDLNGGLHAYEGYIGSSQFLSMTVSGFLSLSSGDIVSVYVLSSRDNSYSVSSDSGFSVNFLSTPMERPAFLADVSSSSGMAAKKGQFYELTRYTTYGASSLFESGGSVLKMGRFAAPADGSYYAAANIRIVPTSKTAIIYVRIVINGQVTNGSLSVQGARGGVSTASFSISISGSFRLKTNDYLSVFVGSSADTSFTIQTESGFSVALIGNNLLAGLMTSQVSFVGVSKIGVSTMSGYTDSSNYLTTTGAGTGVYVMPQSGWYYVSYNMIVYANSASQVSAGIAVAGRSNVDNGMESTLGSPANSYFTLSGAGTMRLNKGQSVSVYVNSIGDGSFRAQTSLSTSAVAPGTPMPAFFGSVGGRTNSKTGWTSSRYYYMGAGVSFQFQSGQNLVNTGTGFFNVPVSGLYAVLATVEINSLNDDITRLVIAVNGQLITDGGMAATIAPPPTSSFDMHTGGILSLQAGDTVELAVYSHKDTSYRVQNAYFAAAMLAMPINALGFSVDFTADMALTAVRKMTTLTSWQILPSTNGSHGLFSAASFDLAKGVFTAPKTGIYLVQAQVQLDKADVGFFTIQATLNNSAAVATGMQAMKTGSTAKASFTQNIGGVMFLNQGTTLQVDVQSDSDKAYAVSSSSGFSASFVAQLGRVQALHASLSSDQAMTSTGYRDVWNWATSSVEPFISSPYFDAARGRFTVHTRGYYYVSTTITFDQVSSGYISAILEREGQLGGGWLLNSQKGPSVSKSSDSSVNTIVASTIVLLQKYDRLKVKVYSSSDNRYVLRKSSSFSVVFVGGSTPQRCPITGVRVITQPVARQIVAVDDPASIWVNAISDNAINYVWYFQSKLTTLKTRYYNISTVAFSNRGNYYCRASSGLATDNSFTGYLDVYQPKPVWRTTSYRASVYENTPLKRLILTVRATVENTLHQQLTAVYSVTGGVNAGDFSLNANSGQLTIAKSIDRERQASYTILLLATNKANASKTTAATAYVTILDRNDNAPLCTKSLYTYTVVEGSPKGTIVGAMSATDKDIGVNAQYRFTITGGNAAGYFGIDSTSRNIIINKMIDRESLTSNSFTITLRAANIVSGPTSTCLMRVTVLDVNDNSPTFSPASYSVNQTEAAKVGTVFEMVTATDPDQGSNGTVSYSITAVVPPATGLFSISSKTGDLSLANTLDHNLVPKYTITVTASDGAKTPRSTTAQVVVNVLNGNLNYPLFTLHNYVTSIQENLPKGQSVVTVLATDKDPHPMTYSLASGADSSAFSIDSRSGLIMTTTPLDREFRDPYKFQVVAVDGGSPPKSGTATVVVDVLDVNDNAPAFAHPTYTFSTSETTAVGSALGQIAATDADTGSNGEITYSIVPTQSTFLIQQSSGVLELNAPLDYAAAKRYTLTVRAVDGGVPAMTSTATVIVTVQDANTNAPLFGAATYTASLAENASPGMSVATVTATDPDPGPTGLSYTLLHGASNKFTINNSTGLITLTAAVDYEQQQGYELVVRCSDSFKPSMSSITFVIVQVTDINDNPPIFSPATQAFTVSSLASPGAWIVNASATDADSGSNAAITYSTTNRYLNVSSAGVVTLGASLPDGAFSAQITATDGGSTPLTGTLVITIRAGQSGENPTFILNRYVAFVSENAALMSTIVRPRAQLPGEIGSSQLTYSLSGSASGPFKIDARTGDVTLNSALNRETQASYSLTITATYSPEGLVTALTGSAQLVVTVLDFNDNAPVFVTANRIFSVSQVDPAGTELGRVRATDADTGTNAKVTFGIISGGDGVIRIDPYTGTLYTSSMLNPLQQSVYPVVVSAINNVLYPLQSNITVTVNVRAVNDHKPTFVQATYTFHLKESTVSPFGVGQVSATDIDAGTLGTVTYAIVSPAPSTFTVSSTTGAITLTGALDRETADHVMFQVRASDGATPALWDVCSVYVYVDDVNDNSPVFAQTAYTTTASANTAPGTGIMAVQATDADAGVYGTAGITYAITAGDPNQRFTITSSGIVQIQHLLSQLPATTYTLTVQASDGGSPPLSTTTSVTVTVLPTNSTAPVFEFSSFSVVQSDQIASGSVVFTASAKGSGTITYSIDGTGLPFTISATTGAVSAKMTLNADAQSVYAIPIVATDQYGQKSTMHLIVTLTHINEHAPVFNPLNSTASVSEGASIGTSVLIVRATDQDTGSDGMVSYVMATTGPFNIDPISGVVELARRVDRETRGVYSIVIDAMDHGMPSLTAETYVTVTVGDINDNPPMFEFSIYNGTVPENQPAGTFAVRPVARDPDLNPMLVYSLPNPDGIFTINPSTGAITTLKPLDREKTAKYDLIVQVSDGKYTSLCQVDIQVFDGNDHGPVFATLLYTATVSANSPIGTSIVRVEATDMDVGTNAIIAYSMPYLFQLSSFIGIDDAGLITIIDSPISVTQSEFIIKVVATDSLNTSLTASTTLNLALTNVELPPTEKTVGSDSSSSFSTPQLVGVAIGAVALIVLILILVIVLVRKPKNKPPSTFEDTVHYDVGGSSTRLGGGFTNPMYAGEVTDDVKQNPVYGAEGAAVVGTAEDDTYDNVGMFQDRTQALD